MKLFISVLAFMTVLIGVVGCTSDTLELAPNGDSRLREISFKGKNLVPEFSPTITQYSIYSDGSDLVFGKILTYMFHTKFTLNGSTVRMNTNGYRLPDNTDLTSYFTNSLVNPGSKVMVIDTVALDGNKRKYTVTLRGDASDASLKDISSTNAILREPFKEYPAPLYRASSYPQDFYSDQYYLTASTNYAHILIRKSQADAKLFSSVSPTVEQGPGIKDVVLGFTNFGSSYNGTLYYITNVSADGQTRNVKQIWIRFYQPANDGRILQLTACRENTDMEIPYLPKFINTANNTYSLLADNCETISFKGIKSQQDAVVSVKIDGVANNSLVSTASDGVSFTVSAIQVTTGTVIEISCNKGSGTMTHTFNVRAFTKTPYGFDGKISELIRDIQTRKEIP